LVYINFDISSFSLISYRAIAPVLHYKIGAIAMPNRYNHFLLVFFFTNKSSLIGPSTLLLRNTKARLLIYQDEVIIPL
ncbi:hypothetical protein, partial [Prevotella aurantiaca]